MSESELFLQKAERSFGAAELMIAEGNLDFAASRAYYSYFYIAESLLLSRGLEFSRHGQVIAQYGNHFARTALLDPSFHTLLIQAFSLRQAADYEGQVEFPRAEILELIQEGRRFLKAAREYLEMLPPEPGDPEAPPAAAEE
jgi:uncharacterized protein (UPF0332 family)